MIWPKTSHGADVLFIGDSHSASCFGENLYTQLRGSINSATGKPLTVRSEATCGSSATSWIQPNGNKTTCGYRTCDPKAFIPCSGTQLSSRGSDRCDANENCIYGEDLVKGHAPPMERLLSSHPKLTVIALGTNMLTDEAAAIEPELDDAEALIQKIKAAHSECLWIGPPDPLPCKISQRGYKAFVARLRTKVEGLECTFVDSSRYTSRENIQEWQTVRKTGKRLHNCVHYECEAGKQWSHKVFADANFQRSLSSAFARPGATPGAGSGPQPASP
jgi:hypothetical protein